MAKLKESKMRGIQVHSDEFLKIKDLRARTEVMLKVFKRRVKEARLLLDLKERSYFEKPSTTRRRKRNLAISRQKMQ